MATTKTRPSSRSASSRSSAGDGASKDEERYRRAAEDALQQLDWAIGYLHGIRKTQISRALAKNRAYIRTRLLGQDAQPDPSLKTDQT
jgi:hypothetical protein